MKPFKLIVHERGNPDAVLDEAIFHTPKAAAEWLYHNFNWEWEGEEGPDILVDHYLLRENTEGYVTYRGEDPGPKWWPDSLQNEAADILHKHEERINEAIDIARLG